jgi:hypothetical protein
LHDLGKPHGRDGDKNKKPKGAKGKKIGSLVAGMERPFTGR